MLVVAAVCLGVESLRLMVVLVLLLVMAEVVADPLQYWLSRSSSFRPPPLSAGGLRALAGPGGLKGLEERAEEERRGSLAWMATGYCLLALPMAEHAQEEEEEEEEEEGRL